MKLFITTRNFFSYANSKIKKDHNTQSVNFCWPLCCLSFLLRFLVSPLVSSIHLFEFILVSTNTERNSFILRVKQEIRDTRCPSLNDETMNIAYNKRKEYDLYWLYTGTRKGFISLIYNVLQWKHFEHLEIT